MNHTYFGKIRVTDCQGKLAIEGPDINPFQNTLQLSRDGWIFFGDIKDVLSLIASVELFRSANSGNITALVTSHRLIDGPLTDNKALMSFIAPDTDKLCARLGIPISLLEIGRSRFSAWCSVVIMGGHPIAANYHTGVAVHWMQSRVKGPSAAGAIAQYFRQLSIHQHEEHENKRVFRAIGGHLLPNLS